jgi:hypothetical protein
MLDHLERVRVRLLMLARLLLIDYLLLNMLILEGALGSIVRASRGGLLLVEKRLGRRHLASIVGRLSEVKGLSDSALGDMVGRRQLLPATVAVLGPVVGASFPFGLSGWLCGIGSQACQERLHLSHTDGMVCVSRALFGCLKHRVAFSISNDTIALYTLVVFEMAPITVEVPGYLHDR